jgi:hypothetical protein
LGSILTIYYLKTFEINLFGEYYGDFALVETMLLLIYGSMIDFTHTAKWSSTMKLLKIRGSEWSLQESRVAERRALTYIMAGVFLFIQIIILASI